VYTEFHASAALTTKVQMDRRIRG